MATEEITTIASDEEFSTEDSASQVSDLIESGDEDFEWEVDPRSIAPSDYLSQGSEAYFSSSARTMPSVERMQRVIESLEARAKKDELARKKRNRSAPFPTSAVPAMSKSATPRSTCSENASFQSSSTPRQASATATTPRPASSTPRSVATSRPASATPRSASATSRPASATRRPATRTG